MAQIYDIHTDNLQVVTCWCGVRHAIPSTLYRVALQSGKGVFCPSGHKWSFGESEADTLKKKLADEQAARQRERARADQREAKLRDERDHAEAQRRGEKAAKTRIKNRVAAGVCPCCNRTFQNLAAHMKGQHPDYAKTDA